MSIAEHALLRLFGNEDNLMQLQQERTFMQTTDRFRADTSQHGQLARGWEHLGR
ncbi:MAG: hypothetical protein ACYTDV_18200 [Planctomycetota bacterium]